MPRRVLLILIAVLAIFFILPASRSIAATGFITNDTPLWTTTDTNTASSATTTVNAASTPAVSSKRSTPLATTSSTNQTLQTTTTQSSQTIFTPTYQSVRYGYDELDRLQSAQYEDGTVISYAYDKTGNRTSKSTASGTLASLSITAATSGYGSIVPLGTIGVPSGSSQTFFIEQDISLAASSCPGGYTFSYAHNRCEKSPPECPSGYNSFNTSTHLCENIAYSSYTASCAAGTLNVNTGLCEYPTTEISVTKTYAPPTGIYGNNLSSYDDLREPLWMCGYLVTASPDSRISNVSGYTAGGYSCYAESEVAVYSCDPDGFNCAYNGTTYCDYRHNTGWGTTTCLNSGGFCTNGVKTIACNITGISALNPCPSGGTLFGNTCQASQQCPNGGALSGTTCTVTTVTSATPVCTSGYFESSNNLCYSYPPGVLTSLLVDNAAVDLLSLQSMPGGASPKYYYTFSNVTAPHTITAGFLAAPSSVCTNPPARISGTTPVDYLSLQSAYNAATNGNSILGNQYDHYESLLFDREISVILDGGYNCDFSSISGNLTIKGTMIISKGSVTVNGNTILAAP